MEARVYFVEGRVQGVGFRWFVEDVARQLGVSGYVRNLSDGRVEVYAVAEEKVLTRLKEQLEAGPRASRVSRVEGRPAARKEYDGFFIEPDA